MGTSQPDDPPAAPLRPLLRRAGDRIRTLIRRSATTIALVVMGLLVLRAYESTQGPPLHPWHTIVPEEPRAEDIVRGGWQAYLAAEEKMFEQLQRRLQARLEPADRTPLNRYFEGSRTSPAAFGHDWNRSFLLEPAGAATGVVVLVHGLTDSPYSMTRLAGMYRQRGFVAIVPRMPGHGTVPAGLTREGREEWEAAVDMAMTEAVRRAGGRLPVHLVGYSNGGALALLHVVRRIERGATQHVDRIILVSPMIKINDFARYAGLAGLPALLGRFDKSAWQDLLPEYNPFKYNSFPLRAARESYRVTSQLHEIMQELGEQQRMARMPPILAFQSAVDDTVSAQGVITHLFDRLPANGSELVLFDVNRNRVMGPLLSAAKTDWVPGALGDATRRYTLTVVGAASADDARVVARSRSPGATSIQQADTGLRYPRDVYSLSHIALLFPADDALYGNRPSGRDIVQLGAIAVRGERDTLVLSQDSLTRLSHNPFYGYMEARIAETVRKDP